MSLFGPTKPLQPPAPLPRDIVESDALVALVSSVTATNVTRQVLELVETLAIVMVRGVSSQSARGSDNTGGQQVIDDGLSSGSSTTELEREASSSNHSSPPWARAMAFGSTGIDANVKSSDVDVYVG